MIELAEFGSGEVIATYPDVETALSEVTAMPDNAKRNAFLREKSAPPCSHCKAPGGISTGTVVPR